MACQRSSISAWPRALKRKIAQIEMTTRSLTGAAENLVAGTAAYMSPEQAEGKKLDARSDIFSFGAVLYEMVTGWRVFRGDSTASTLAAVLKHEPEPPSRIAPQVPRELERIIQRCLRKDPNRRFQHMSDLKVELEDVREESESGVQAAVQAPAQARRRFGLQTATARKRCNSRTLAAFAAHRTGLRTGAKLYSMRILETAAGTFGCATAAEGSLAGSRMVPATPMYRASRMTGRGSTSATIAQAAQKYFASRSAADRRCKSPTWEVSSHKSRLMARRFTPSISGSMQSGEGALCEAPVGGGQERPLGISVFGRTFAVVSEGIYYIGVAGKDGRGREIRFYDFPSRGSRLIQALGNADIHIGLTVSPDRKIFLYSVAGDNGRNLMLVENFL